MKHALSVKNVILTIMLLVWGVFGCKDNDTALMNTNSIPSDALHHQTDADVVCQVSPKGEAKAL